MIFAIGATVARTGWWPCSFACTECGAPPADPECCACDGTGWLADLHIVNDGLYVAGDLIATIESFTDDPWGPWYANVVTPAGQHERRVMSDHAAAAHWAEVAAGYRVARLTGYAVRAITSGRQRDTKRVSRARARGRG